jgi:hypothetical protein
LPSNLSRFLNYSKSNYQYPGGLYNRFDMYLWGTKGFGGGAGGDWGQRVSENNIITAAANAAGPSSAGMIIGHEIGHGFGLYDFYAPFEESRPPTVSGCPVFGQGDLRTIMVAGSGTAQFAFDLEMIRYYWNWVRAGSPSNRFKMPAPTNVMPPIAAAAAQSAKQPQFRFDNRGTLRYDLGGAQTADLKIFNSRGRLVRVMRLSGAQTTANINLNVANQMLIWSVETQGRVIDQGRTQFVSR